MRVSDVEDLRGLIGKEVRLREDSKGVPAGTVGKVVTYGYQSIPYERGAGIQWITVDWVDRKEVPIIHVIERSPGNDRTRLLELV